MVMLGCFQGGSFFVPAADGFADLLSLRRKEKCGLAFDYGDWFGGDEYACFVRMNLATSKENVKRAIEKMTKNIPGAN